MDLHLGSVQMPTLNVTVQPSHDKECALLFIPEPHLRASSPSGADLLELSLCTIRLCLYVCQVRVSSTYAGYGHELTIYLVIFTL